MNRIFVTAFLGACVLSSCGTADLVRDEEQVDSLSGMDESEFGASITRRRNLEHYQEAQALASRDPLATRILVTTRDASPDPRTFAIAEAIHAGMQVKYPLAEFQVAGNGRIASMLDAIDQRFDYVFVVITNFDTRQYEGERTVYGTRSTGVRCRPSHLAGAIDCDERGGEAVPVGTAKTRRSIYTERFIVDYGPSSRATLMYDGGSQQIVGISDRTGHTMVQMITGTSDSTWCDKDDVALQTLARFSGAHLTTLRPDELNMTLDPDSLGCNG
ncbi:MAG: hypothetical protein ACJ8GV_05710 [Luteimonas sp.]